MSAVLSAEILRARRRGVTSSEHTTKHGAMAQLVAHHTGSVGVRGSSPLSSTITGLREPGTETIPASVGSRVCEGVSLDGRRFCVCGGCALR